MTPFVFEYNRLSLLFSSNSCSHSWHVDKGLKINFKFLSKKKNKHVLFSFLPVDFI